MKARILCVPILVTLALDLAQANVHDTRGPRGVAPSRSKLYTPDSAGNWQCFDGTKVVPFTAINDDYCDCLDGSDEPGTSACGNSYFYCENAGHIPAYLISSRVNDGVCDPECCDGTDEYDGNTHCPNICEEVGTEAKKERERIRKIEREGSDIRKGYIAYGKDAKKRLQEQLEKVQVKATQIRQKAADTKAELDSVKVKQQEYLESTKAERKKAREIQLAPLIEQQSQRLVRAIEAKNLLRTTLEELKENHNKNYHDLAVKDTISGFDEYLEELKQAAADAAQREEERKERKKDENKELSAKQRLMALQSETYYARKEIGRMFHLIKTMKETYNTEYNDEAVLKAIKAFEEFAPQWDNDLDEFVGEKLIEIPEEVLPNFEDQGKESKETLGAIYGRARNIAKSVGLGFLFYESKSETERIQEAYNKASEEERKIEEEIKAIERKLEMDFGKDETFAQLVDQCFEYKDIEYTYSLCLFGSATQKSNGDTSLGTFSSWVGNNYDTQLYTGGLRCWNGPERSVNVVMSCGAVNEIVSISESNRCEYLFKFRTPAVCRLSNTEMLGDQDVVPEVHMPSVVSKGETKKKHDEL
ncbi:glucosidase II beta subunit-like-domain-containing protein [Gamsiella multidivaricata]|uniref:glucosidase II beta subunit-like-domain-containing protein n=1 Tax=Gamsiella multidivaricata TaxID=101098 RepID=UPI00221EF27F|nr:glucosidase II beta subunit-like-domain-containing protein [Gamsiella multidivaricata]KAG0367302.1 hypothetical protein BGZ54_004092 [Gamsiella multidivaricata]KAI7816487.1 glucosidase II beta subunit-like-domain-containing protein [Gamsiella multidivaricata]